MKRTAIYLAVALVTFGHSASGQQNCHPGFWDGPLFQTSCSAYRGGVAASFWPLYWSWVAADAIRPLPPAKDGEA